MKRIRYHSVPNSRTAFAVDHDKQKRTQSTQSVEQLLQPDWSLLNARQPRLLQLALKEAAALAWTTDFPQLFFPVLAAEKVQATAAWYRRQTTILNQNKILQLAA